MKRSVGNFVFLCLLGLCGKGVRQIQRWYGAETERCGGFPLGRYSGDAGRADQRCRSGCASLHLEGGDFGSGKRQKSGSNIAQVRAQLVRGKIGRVKNSFICLNNQLVKKEKMNRMSH